MLASSFTEYTFRVYSASRGRLSGSVVYSPSNQTAFFILNEDLQPGDLIQVTLTDDIMSELGTNLQGGYAWEFTVDNCASADFYPADEFPAPSQGPNWPQRLVTADFTGDGAVDVVVASSSTYNPLALMVNDGNGGLNADEPISLGTNTGVDGPSTGDFDRDGDFDLAVPCSGTETLVILFNDGSGNFTIGHTYSVSGIDGGSAAGDINGDGAIDIVATLGDPDRVGIFLNSGYGSFSIDATWPTLDVPIYPLVLDVNNDGALDVVVGSPATDSVSVLINEHGRFSTRHDFPAGLALSNLTAADFDGDGFVDLASTSISDNLCGVYTNSGLGTFTLVQTFSGVSSSAIGAADVDGDGDFDLLTGTYDDDELEWAENNGGVFTLNNICCADRVGNDVAAVDLDGEGSVDVLCLNNSHDKIAVVRNFGPPAPPQLAAPPEGKVLEAPARPRLTCLETPGGQWYQFQFDDDPAFGSPQSSSPFHTQPYWFPTYAVGVGTYYWRVRSANTCGQGDWSEVWTIEVESDPVTPSCPVLFVGTDKGMVQENPLLTACERSGYINTVVDYYKIQSPLAVDDGRVRVELRELEDEITYLERFELMTVDHPISTRVACAVDGSVTLFTESMPPLSAMTNEGIDVSNLLVESDGKRFEAESGGSLTLTFPQLESSRAIMLTAQKKPPCPHEDDPGEKRPAAFTSGAFTVEQRVADGQWSLLAEPPTREAAVNQFITLDRASFGKDGTVTVRITWERSLSVDAVSQILETAERASVQTHQPADYSVERDRPTMEAWSGFASNQPLTLRKNDRLSCSFAVPALTDKGMRRTYIVKAVGRYHPDYGVYKDLMPNQYTLYENYPNPFNPSTTISYDIPAPTTVTLDIINVLGQTIRTLVQEHQPSGHHRVVWDGRTDSGQPVASGIYFYRLTAETYVDTKKMLLLK
ncbi:T9SS type A sorting domain-containing protein [candidate division GN15 bacterium]|nr:T9SS type A sorting domain-containing protein [candidate division GN15 bacterium]